MFTSGTCDLPDADGGTVVDKMESEYDLGVDYELADITGGPFVAAFDPK